MKKRMKKSELNRIKRVFKYELPGVMECVDVGQIRELINVKNAWMNEKLDRENSKALRDSGIKLMIALDDMLEHGAPKNDSQRRVKQLEWEESWRRIFDPAYDSMYVRG